MRFGLSSVCPRSFGSPFIGSHRRFSLFSFMSFCLHVSSSSSFLSLARTVKRGKERRKERERERKGEERKVFPATNNRPGTHQTRRGVILSIPFRNTPESKKVEKGREGGGGGAKCSTGSNEPQKCFGRSDHVEAFSQLGPLRSRNGVSQLGIPKMRQTSHFLRHEPSAVRSGHLHLQSKGDNDKPPFNGFTGGTLRAHPGLSLGETHLWICVLTWQRCHTPA